MLVSFFGGLVPWSESEHLIDLNILIEYFFMDIATAGQVYPPPPPAQLNW